MITANKEMLCLRLDVDDTYDYSVTRDENISGIYQNQEVVRNLQNKWVNKSNVHIQKLHPQVSNKMIATLSDMWKTERLKSKRKSGECEEEI